MRIEVNLNDTWVDEVVAASLRDFIQRYNANTRDEPDTPIKAMKKVLKFYSVHEDYEAFIKDLEDTSLNDEEQTNLDF